MGLSSATPWAASRVDRRSAFGHLPCCGGTDAVDALTMRRVASRRWPAGSSRPANGQQEARGLLALAADRLVNSGQRRIGRRQLDVVEADDADVCRDGKAAIAQARMAPIAIASLIARIAVGRRPVPQACSIAATPPAWVAGLTNVLVAPLDPDGRHRAAVAAQPSRDGVLGALRRVFRPLDGDDQHVAVTETSEMFGGGVGTALVVDVDRRQLVERVRVDGRHRQTGPPDLGDLRVVGGKADRDHPSTVARAIARDSDVQGEMKWRA